MPGGMVYVTSSVPTYQDPSKHHSFTATLQALQHPRTIASSYTGRRISGDMLLDRLNKHVQCASRRHRTQHCPLLHER
jgi:hypothetical protein